MWTPDICIYHDPCDDGFGSAWAVWRKWGEAVDFRPTNYGLPVPDEAIDGQHVLISDFSFKPDVLEALAARAASIVILDHHKTAESDLIAYRVASAVTAAHNGKMMNAMPATLRPNTRSTSSGSSWSWARLGKTTSR